ERGGRLRSQSGALERIGHQGQRRQVRPQLRGFAERLNRRGDPAELQVPMPERDQDPVAIIRSTRRRRELAELARGGGIVAERVERVAESLAVFGAAAGLRGGSKPSGRFLDVLSRIGHLAEATEDGRVSSVSLEDREQLLPSLVPVLSLLSELGACVAHPEPFGGVP